MGLKSANSYKNVMLSDDYKAYKVSKIIVKENL